MDDRHEVSHWSTSPGGPRILVCYDGSLDARAAVDRVATLMPGAAATVLVVWETMLDALARNGSLGLGFGLAGFVDDDGAADATMRRRALETAQEGAQRATDAGLAATARVACREGAIADEILVIAQELDADLVALGTRGRGGVKSMMLGSVSQAVVHHADRPVLVVPSAEVAAHRRSWTDHAGGVTAPALVV